MRIFFESEISLFILDFIRSILLETNEIKSNDHEEDSDAEIREKGRVEDAKEAEMAQKRFSRSGGERRRQVGLLPKRITSES